MPLHSLHSIPCLAASLFALTTLAGCPSAPPPQASHPFPQHIAYSDGALSVSTRTQTQLDDDVRAAYALWKGNYLRAMSGGRYRVKFSADNNSPTVSEGQGYGMIIIAIMAGHDPDAKEIFDGLWRFVLDHKSEIDPRLPDWFVNANESPDNNGDTSAFDGDADVAYALLLADVQWGSAGNINYLERAKEIIQAIFESEVGPNSDLPLLGDWVDPNGDEIDEYVTRSSDFMPGHFRAFALASNNNAWLDVVDACQDAIDRIQTVYSPVTGLLPDFLAPLSDEDNALAPAPADLTEGPHDGHYNYNAGRDPWRIGTDWLLNGDASSRAQVQKISAWAEDSTGGDPLEIKPGYLLDGAPIPPAEYFTTFFAAPLGVAAMCTPGQQEWLNDIYTLVFNREEGYYEDSVTLLSMLVMTHNFWDPTQF